MKFLMTLNGMDFQKHQRQTKLSKYHEKQHRLKSKHQIQFAVFLQLETTLLNKRIEFLSENERTYKRANAGRFVLLLSEIKI